MAAQRAGGASNARRPHGIRTPPGALGRRAPALLTAAVLGGVLASQLSASLDRDRGQPIVVADSGQQMTTDAATFNEETDPRRDVALMAAAERLQQVQASRAAREAERRAEEAQRRTLPLQGTLTTAFGMRWGEMHYGVDIAAPMLTPEYAAAAGTVLRAGPASGYGNVIYIQHANGDVTVYGHMEQVLVKTGEVVQSGQLIARVGSRGFSTGPHLHFEVWVGGLDGRRVDPLDWLAEQGITL